MGLKLTDWISMGAGGVGYLIGGPVGSGILAGVAGGVMASVIDHKSFGESLMTGLTDGATSMIPGGMVGGAVRNATGGMLKGALKSGAESIIKSGAHSWQAVVKPGANGLTRGMAQAQHTSTFALRRGHVMTSVANKKAGSAAAGLGAGAGNYAAGAWMPGGATTVSRRRIPTEPIPDVRTT